MGVAVLTFVLTFLTICHCASSSGTLYQKVASNDKSDADVPTRGFHQCSLKNNCNYVGIPAGNIGSKVHFATTMQELRRTDKKLQIWKKIKLEDLKRSASSVKEFKSCKEAMKAGMHKNGTVKLSLVNKTKVEVYCDMVTDGGGWIVFQRRINDKMNFERDWQAYENKFGDFNGNFWLGLKALHKFTSVGNWTLRIDLKASNGDRGYGKYTDFKIGSGQKNYPLMFDKFSGNVGDCLGMGKFKGGQFTTFDKDNDINESGNCANDQKGAWWYKNCFPCNLNSWYPSSIDWQNWAKTTRMSWFPWKEEAGDIVFSEMKIKIEA